MLTTVLFVQVKLNAPFAMNLISFRMENVQVIVKANIKISMKMEFANHVALSWKVVNTAITQINVIPVKMVTLKQVTLVLNASPIWMNVLENTLQSLQ